MSGRIGQHLLLLLLLMMCEGGCACMGVPHHPHARNTYLASLLIALAGAGAP